MYVSIYRSPRLTGRSSFSPSRPPPPAKSLPSIHVTPGNRTNGVKPNRPHPPRPSPPPKRGLSLGSNIPRAKVRMME